MGCGSYLGENKFTSLTVLKIGSNTLTKVAKINLGEMKWGNCHVLKIYRYFGNRLLFFAFFMSGEENLCFFEFGTESCELKRVKSGLNHRERSAFKVDRLGDEFYYTGCEGKVLKLSLEFNPEQ